MVFGCINSDLALFLLLIVEANDCGATGQEHIHIAGVNMKVVIPYIIPPLPTLERKISCCARSTLM